MLAVGVLARFSNPLPWAVGWLLPALVTTCLIASANDTINELLDVRVRPASPDQEVSPVGSRMYYAL